MKRKMKNTYMKWLVVVLLVALSLVWFAGCGNDGGDGKDNGTTGVTQEEQNNNQDGTGDTNGQEGENDDGTTTDGDGTTSSGDGTNSSGDGTSGGGTGTNTGTPTTPTTPSTPASTCTIQINCSLLVGKDLTGTGLETIVPASGVILGTTKVNISPGDTVYDVTLRITKAKGIHMASEGSLAMGNLYVAAISNIYEKAYNSKSGWVYLINGAKPGIGSGVKELKAGDKLVWAYSLNLGNDL